MHDFGKLDRGLWVENGPSYMTSQDLEAPLVVYVDDEHANRIVFEHSLRGEFQIRSVESGAAALKILETADVAVVVTDMRMPEMTGEELLRVVAERSPQTIRMVITAYADVDPILRAINEGLVARYILKPWTRAELVQVLRWATEAWSFSRDSAALNRRLLETERLATLGSIAGAIAHDLKQPLAALDLNTKRLDELTRAVPAIQRLVDGDADLEPDARAQIAELVEELTELSFDIRAGAIHLRGVAGTLSQFLQPPPKAQTATDPAPVIRHAMTVCQELAVRARAALIYDTTPVPRVRMPATELTQVLINVITNAIYAIAARARPGGRVLVTAVAREQSLVIEISDDGAGMPPEVLSRVGTPFFTTRTEGTGLGISQCQRLVGGAGGRFHIASSPNEGTTVTITLPLARP